MFVSRPEVQCYENQTSVGLVPVTNFPLFSCSTPVLKVGGVERQVVTPDSRSEIRDGAPWERRRRSFLQGVPYKTRIHPGRRHPASGYAFIYAACRYIRRKRRRKRERERKSKTIGGNHSWNQLAKEDFMMQRTFDGRIILYSLISRERIAFRLKQI